MKDVEDMAKSLEAVDWDAVKAKAGRQVLIDLPARRDEAMAGTLEIHMQSGMIGCNLCGEPTEFRWGIPACNGDPVSNDFVPSDDEQGGGVSVCEECHRKHEDGRMRTFDAIYQPRGVMGVVLLHGAGI